ncbi:RPA family protein [Methanocella sp. MCL-LM]|uniref:RPA family protein n=1 Tax=Methanocella sp. MCL-LM TaxID=3412035 RepID=UPI003C71FC0F
MTDRETARRVFAREFNDASLQYGEHTDRAPNFVITPTGAMCNRIFAVGVLTEVENIGSAGQVLYRARLADPTGAFTIYAGQYQQEIATFLSGLETPAYVAVAGKARIFSPEPGAHYTSIRPEDVNVIDRNVRDRWTCHTAKLTLDRIAVMEKALASGLRGEELTWHLIRHTEDGAGVSKAIDHYGVTRNTLEAYKQMVTNALSTMIEPEQPAEPKADLGDVILKTIARLDAGDGASYKILLAEMENSGVGEDSVEQVINELMSKGQCYEPKIGMLKLA